MSKRRNKPKGSEYSSRWLEVLDSVTNILIIPVLVLSVICSIVMINAKRSNSVTNLFGYSLVTILSESMVDSGFEVDDTVMVKQEDTTEIKVGDVIAYYKYLETNGDVKQLAKRAEAKEEIEVTEASYFNGNTPNYSKFSSWRLYFNKVFANLTYTATEASERAVRANSTIIFHQVVDIVEYQNSLWFRTWGTSNVDGNGNPQYDSYWIKEDYVIGVYTNTSSVVRSFLGFASTNTGIIWMVEVPSGIQLILSTLELIEIIDMMSRIKHDQIARGTYVDRSIYRRMLRERKKLLASGTIDVDTYKRFYAPYENYDIKNQDRDVLKTSININGPPGGDDDWIAYGQALGQGQLYGDVSYGRNGPPWNNKNGTPSGNYGSPYATYNTNGREGPPPWSDTGGRNGPPWSDSGGRNGPPWNDTGGRNGPPWSDSGGRNGPPWSDSGGGGENGRNGPPDGRDGPPLWRDSGGGGGDGRGGPVWNNKDGPPLGRNGTPPWSNSGGGGDGRRGSPWSIKDGPPKGKEGPPVWDDSGDNSITKTNRPTKNKDGTPPKTKERPPKRRVTIGRIGPKTDDTGGAVKNILPTPKVDDGRNVPDINDSGGGGVRNRIANRLPVKKRKPDKGKVEQRPDIVDGSGGVGDKKQNNKPWKYTSVVNPVDTSPWNRDVSQNRFTSPPVDTGGGGFARNTADRSLTLYERRMKGIIPQGGAKNEIELEDEASRFRKVIYSIKSRILKAAKKGITYNRGTNETVLSFAAIKELTNMYEWTNFYILSNVKITNKGRVVSPSSENHIYLIDKRTKKQYSMNTLGVIENVSCGLIKTDQGLYKVIIKPDGVNYEKLQIDPEYKVVNALQDIFGNIFIGITNGPKEEVVTHTSDGKRVSLWNRNALLALGDNKRLYFITMDGSFDLDHGRITDLKVVSKDGELVAVKPTKLLPKTVHFISSYGKYRFVYYNGSYLCLDDGYKFFDLNTKETYELPKQAWQLSESELAIKLSDGHLYKVKTMDLISLIAQGADINSIQNKTLLLENAGEPVIKGNKLEYTATDSDKRFVISLNEEYLAKAHLNLTRVSARST